MAFTTRLFLDRLELRDTPSTTPIDPYGGDGYVPVDPTTTTTTTTTTDPTTTTTTTDPTTTDPTTTTTTTDPTNTTGTPTDINSLTKTSTDPYTLVP